MDLGQTKVNKHSGAPPVPEKEKYDGRAPGLGLSLSLLSPSADLCHRISVQNKILSVFYHKI